MACEAAKLRGLRARAVNVPLARPLQTGGGAVATAPLVLVDLQTDAGITGSAYVFCYTPLALAPVARLIETLNGVIAGLPLAPLDIAARLQSTFRLLGCQGFVGMAIAAVDMAAWDAQAKVAGLPLARLLGAAPRPVPAYNSNGLGIIGPDKAAAEAQQLVAEGFDAIKLRLGYADFAADLAVVRAVRAAVGDAVQVMSDYNQCLSVPEAKQRVTGLDGEGLYWIEEPTRCDDYEGHAEIRAVSPVPIQLGENCWGPHDMEKALAAGACDYFMADVMKIGGVTGWLRAAALAEARGVPLSCHLFPEVSAHLLAATSGCHWLEYVDWAGPILREPLALEGGAATAREAPGVGLAWNEDAVAKFLA